MPDARCFYLSPVTERFRLFALRTLLHACITSALSSACFLGRVTSTLTILTTPHGRPDRPFQPTSHARMHPWHRPVHDDLRLSLWAEMKERTRYFLTTRRNQRFFFQLFESSYTRRTTFASFLDRSQIAVFSAACLVVVFGWFSDFAARLTECERVIPRLHDEAGSTSWLYERSSSQLVEHSTSARRGLVVRS